MRVYSHSLVKRKKRSGGKQKKGYKKITLLFLGFLLFVSCCIYIFQINKIATLGYEIKNKEDEINKIKQENRQYKIMAAQYKSVLNTELAKKENEDENCFLKKMKEPEEVGFLEIVIEKDFAMK